MTAKTRYLTQMHDASYWARFVDEYLKDFNGGAAWLRTFGPARGNPSKFAEKLISGNGWIRAEIQRRSNGRLTLADLTPERVKLELLRMATFDARKTVRVEAEEDDLKTVEIPLAFLDEDTARAVTEVSYDVRGNRILKTDKSFALGLLAKMTGALPDLRYQSANARAAEIVHHTSTGDDEILALLEESVEDDEEAIDVGDEIEGELSDDGDS